MQSRTLFQPFRAGRGVLYITLFLIFVVFACYLSFSKLFYSLEAKLVIVRAYMAHREPEISYEFMAVS